MHVEQDVLRQGQDRLAVKKMNMEFDRSLDPEAGPAGMTDHYTGDENKDIKARDVQDWARDYNEQNSFEKQFDVRYCMLGALLARSSGRCSEPSRCGARTPTSPHGHNRTS